MRHCPSESNTDIISGYPSRRHIPASIHNAGKLKREMLDARKAKEENRRRHTKAGREKPKAERKKVMLGEDV